MLAHLHLAAERRDGTEYVRLLKWRSSSLKRIWTSLAMVCTLATGCGGEGDGPEGRAEPVSEQQIVTEMGEPLDWSVVRGDLALGDEGPAIRQVYRYLLRYGYFENPILKRNYPGWSPIVATTPTSLQVFTPELEEAVRQLQARAALPATGIVDADTIALMQQVRCTHPDGFEADAHKKWDFNPTGFHTDGQITFKILNYPSPERMTAGTTQATVLTALVAAMQQWQNNSNLTFQAVSSPSQPADITFSWVDKLPTPPGGTAQTEAVPFGSKVFTIKFENASPIKWSTTSSTPSDAYDIMSITAHEVGHALGFVHSSRTMGGTPVMWPGINMGEQRRALLPDDRQALLSSPYTPWDVNPTGRATDIATGGGAVWAIGETAAGEDYPVFRKKPDDSWEQIADSWAVKVAVEPNGTPWVLNAAHNIFRRRGVERTNRRGNDWGTGPIPGGGTDIAVGAEGTVYLIGDDNAGGGNHSLFRWDGSAFVYEPGMTGVHVAVDSNGNPWVARADFTISRRMGGVWSTVPGNGLARDIAAGPNGAVWMISTTAGGSDYRIATWQEQGCCNAWSRWVMTEGWATRVAVGDVPWVVNADHRIFKKLLQ